MEALVLPNLPHYLIIGDPWLQAHKSIKNYEKGTMNITKPNQQGTLTLVISNQPKANTIPLTIPDTQDDEE